MSNVTTLSPMEQEWAQMLRITYNVRNGSSGRNVGFNRYYRDYSIRENMALFFNGTTITASCISGGLFAGSRCANKIKQAQKKLDGVVVVISDNRSLGIEVSRMVGGKFYDMSKVPDYLFKQTTSNLAYKDRLSKDAQATLQRYGGNNVVKIRVYRTALPEQMTTIANLVTSGNWQRAMEKYGYDRFFHLGLVLRLNNGIRILLEKNEQIYITTSRELTNDSTDYYEVQFNKPTLTLNQMINRTKERMGTERFFGYNAFKNNCQMFVMNVLEANNISVPPELRDFIYQDLTDFSADIGQTTARFINFLTNLRRVLS